MSKIGYKFDLNLMGPMLNLGFVVALNLFGCGEAESKVISDEIDSFTDPDHKIDGPVDMLMHVGRYDRAVSILMSDSGIYHKDKPFSRLVISLYLAGRYNDAIVACEKWLSVNESAAKDSKGSVNEIIGMCHYHLSEYKKAISAFNKSIDDSGSSTAYAGRSVAHFALNEFELANEDSRKSGEEDPAKNKPSTIDSQLNLYVYQKNGAPFVEFQPNDNYTGNIPNRKEALALFERAYSLESSGEFNKASKIYHEAATKCKDDPNLWGALALCTLTSIREGDDDEDEKEDLVRNAFKMALLLNPKDWKLWNDLGIVNFLFLEPEEAAKDLAKVLEDSKCPKVQKRAVRQVISLTRVANMLQEHYRPKSPYSKSTEDNQTDFSSMVAKFDAGPPIKEEELKNMEYILPRMGENLAAEAVFKSGKTLLTKSANAEVRATASSTLFYRVAAVSEITINAGGDKTWRVLALVFRKNGKLICFGTHDLGYYLPDAGIMVERLRIFEGKIFVDRKDIGAIGPPPKPLELTISDFSLDQNRQKGSK